MTEDVEGDPTDHPSRLPFKFVRETLGYPIDAFIFVLDGIRLAKQMQATRSPGIGAAAVCDAVRRFGLKHFGSEREARAVFLDWNIRSSEDVGQIVWAMVRGGVIHAEAGDAPEQFAGIFDVEQWSTE